MAVYRTHYVYRGFGIVRISEWEWDTQEAVNAYCEDFPGSRATLTVSDIVPDYVYDEAPESRGFHDPEDADAGGCSWITPQGSY